MENEEKSNGIGGIIGVIIIIVILIAGGWYFIGGRVDKIQDQKLQALKQTATTTEYINLGTTTATSTK